MDPKAAKIIEQMMEALDALLHAADNLYDKCHRDADPNSIRFGTLFTLAVDQFDELRDEWNIQIVDLLPVSSFRQGRCEK